MTTQLLNDTGYTDAKQKYREYITKILQELILIHGY